MAVRISSRVSSVEHNTSTVKKNSKVSSSTKAKSSSKGTTTKAKMTSKAKVNMSTKSNKVSSLGTKTGSSIKQTTTYLRDAPKLYTSSGMAYSYGRPAQSYMAQNKATANKKSGSTTNAAAIKTSSIKTKSGTINNTANKKNVAKATNIVSTSKKNSKTKGNTNQTTAKSITYGRPAESYIAENQAKSKESKGTTSKSAKKSNSLSLPKTTQVPVQKKSAKSNSDKVKIYEPTDSRSGAGKYSYAKKTSPTGAKEGASLLVSSLPIVGDAKDAQEAITGRDLVTGKKLSNTDRMITAAAVVVPVVSGKSINTAKKAVKSPTIKKAVKSGTKKLKQSTEEIVKKAKSGEKVKKGGSATANKTITDNPFDEAGYLKPDIKYQTGEFKYNYETDANGRISNWNTDNLQLTQRDGRLNYNSNTLGKIDGDHAGHLAGDRFGGSPKLDNIVSQSKNVNLSQYKKIENQWAKAISEEKEVTVNVDIKYDADGLRPVEFIVEYTIDGDFFSQSILN